MSGYNTYIGARYIPLPDGEWDSTKAYEPLTIVSYNGDTYTSKTYVPKNTPITNKTYWIRTASYNAQLEHYISQVNDCIADVGQLESDFTAFTEQMNSNYSNFTEQITGDMSDFTQQITGDMTSFEAEIREIAGAGGEIVLPSGDVTGATDVTNIQAALDSKGNVILVDGNYYLNASLKLKAGDRVVGVSRVKTILYITSDVAVFTPKTANTSCDHIYIANMQIVNNVGTSGHAAIEIVPDYIQDNFLGARYSVFQDLWIKNFEKGMAFSVMWCTRFIGCRFQNCDIGMEIGNACNALFILNCQFYGNEQKTQTGLKMLARTGGTENYNVTVISGDFESLAYGVDLYATKAASFFGCYFENVTQAYKLDCVPNFVAKGGNFNGIELLARIDKSNAGYTGGASFEDLYIVCNIDVDKGIITVTDNMGYVYAKNISVENQGSGNIYYTNKELARMRTGVNARAVKELHTGRLRYSDDAWKFSFNGVGVSEKIKLQQIYLNLKSAVTTTNNINYIITDKNNNTIGTGNFNAGEHAAGSIVYITPTASYYYSSLEDNTFTIKPSADPGVDVSFDIVATAYVGEFTPFINSVVPVIPNN